MKTLVSPQVHLLTPYTSEQNADYFLKLDTNENPYPCSPGVKAILNTFDTESLMRYPSANADPLRQALADYHRVNMNQVFVANGSDEVLAMAFLAFFRQAKPLYFPSITYSCYPVFCQLLAIEYRLIALNDNWQIALDEFPVDNGGIVLTNPNAPTGHAHSYATIQSWLEKHQSSVVLVDEAYVDFGTESVLPLLDKFTNLLITRTFSKSRSLAGLRVGYAIGSAYLIQALQTIKDSFNYFNVNRLSQYCAIASLQDNAYFQQCCARIQATRDNFSVALQQQQFVVLPSKTNFVFANPQFMSAAKLHQALRQRGIYIKHFATKAVQDYLRISIGTEAQMQQLLVAIEEIKSANTN